VQPTFFLDVCRHLSTTISTDTSRHSTPTPGLRSLVPHPPLPIESRGCSSQAPSTDIIAPSSNSRRPANIPLHTLSNSSRHIVGQSQGHEDDSDDEKYSRRSRADSFNSDSPGSDFSPWSDTGDLADELDLAEQDPLYTRQAGDQKPRSRSRRKNGKQVHYDQGESHPDTEKRGGSRPGVIRRKEDIQIPIVKNRTISTAEKIIAIIMAPNDGPSRMHGLHGKKLLYEMTES
jgi:hypothetical protein